MEVAAVEDLETGWGEGDIMEERVGNQANETDREGTGEQNLEGSKKTVPDSLKSGGSLK